MHESPLPLLLKYDNYIIRVATQKPEGSIFKTVKITLYHTKEQKLDNDALTLLNARFTNAYSVNSFINSQTVRSIRSWGINHVIGNYDSLVIY